ncbi:glyoxalase/bleomycin resistance/extradiol dioxygenase family protein [Nocardiopsis sp. MG754419]|uniref:VOC family protein n=1 Tax=Nocardiopsis sp. MG754419 TaxID=2259865 RepID=UPI001BA76E6C|nr:VOC family protein [Nocardiopsis sp. MG754419]MBR8740163.1 VOC family protein [Nocardiopsis sp. MG754419]
MKRPVLDSMLLASTDPDRLRDWYAAVLDPVENSTMDGYRVLRFGSFHLLIDHRDDLGPEAADATRIILNFDVDDARAVAALMDERDTSWVAPLEDRDGSLFATARDPDGNYVQIIQLSPEHLAAMERGPEQG